MAQALTSAVQGRTYHRARAAFAEQLHHLLADVVAEQREALLDEMEEGFEDILARVDRGMGQDHQSTRTSTGSDIDGLLSEEEIEHLRLRISEDATIARFIEAWWPTLDTEALLGDLLTDRTLLARFAPQLSPEEIAAVSAEPAPGRRATFPCSTLSPTCSARSKPRNRRASSSPTALAGSAAGCTATSSSTRRRSCPRCSGRWSSGAVPVARSPLSATSTRRRRRIGTPVGRRRCRRRSGIGGPPPN
ncbi:hypothetical protein NKG94_15690 [Micromonospora sp. M12]